MMMKGISQFSSEVSDMVACFFEANYFISFKCEPLCPKVCGPR